MTTATINDLQSRFYVLGFDVSKALQMSDGFTSQYDGQVISGYDILAVNNPVIINHKVVFRNCRIRYKDGHSIQINSGGTGSQLYNLDTACIAIPNAVTPITVSSRGIFLNGAADVSLGRIRTFGGTTSIYAVNSPRLRVRTFRSNSLFGSNGEGQFLFLDNCPNSIVADFSSSNPLAASYVEDLIFLNNSAGTKIERGLLDGLNSPTAFPINVRNSPYCRLEDIDIVRAGKGPMLDHSMFTVWRNVRQRDMHTTGQGGRSAPDTYGMLFNFNFDELFFQTGTRIERCSYYNVPDIAGISDIDNPKTLVYVDLQSRDFTARSELALDWRWSNTFDGPYLISLTALDGYSQVIIDEDFEIGTAVGVLKAESDDISETFTYTIVSDPDTKFEIDGDKLITRGTFNFNLAEQHTVVIKATGNYGQSHTREFTIAVDPEIAMVVTVLDTEADELDNVAAINAEAVVVQNHGLASNVAFANYELDSVAMIGNHIVGISDWLLGYVDMSELGMYFASIEVDAEIETLDLAQNHTLYPAIMVADTIVNRLPMDTMDMPNLLSISFMSPMELYEYSVFNLPIIQSLYSLEIVDLTQIQAFTTNNMVVATNLSGTTVEEIE